ncbi:hypothetical protein MMC22_004930 [Lobaria immixta]|nr:hypothetical protein [Lobaria immixta]
MSPFKVNTLALFLLAISHTTARQSAILDPAYPSDIKCVSVGTDAVATWVNALSQICTWTGKVGANLGINPVNRGDYGCMGRCGGGCGGVSQGDLKEGDPVDASRSIMVANVYT